MPDMCERIAGMKVLVVDDEPDARALVKRLLEECKAVVIVAASAAEAFERVVADRPDVLVSDVGMPGEDGYRPDLGRFSSSDDITITPGDLGNANLYLYVGGNPLNMIDPSGHSEWSISGQIAVGGLALTLAGIVTQLLGNKFHNPTVAKVGSVMSTTGILVAGVALSVALAPAGGVTWAIILRGAAPGAAKLIWSLVNSSLSNGVSDLARSASVSDGLEKMLSSASGPVPLSGRIVQRPGQENWWQMGSVDLNGNRFGNNVVPLQPGDLIYDYVIVGDPAEGKAIVTISRLHGDTFEREVLGTFPVSNGGLGGVYFQRASEDVSNQQLLTP